MDLTATFSGIQSARIRGEVNMAIAKKVMDTQKQSGANILQLLSSATQGAPGSGDAMVAAATGLGGAVDTYA
jgi:hypothetical protein